MECWKKGCHASLNDLPVSRASHPLDQEAASASGARIRTSHMRDGQIPCHVRAWIYAMGHWNYSLCGNYKNDESCLDMMHQASIDSWHLSTLVGEGLLGVAGWFDHASNVRHPRKKTCGQTARPSGFDGLWHWVRKGIELQLVWSKTGTSSYSSASFRVCPISTPEPLGFCSITSAVQATVKDLSSTSRRQKLQERKWGQTRTAWLSYIDVM